MACVIRPFRDDDAGALALLTGAAIRSIGPRFYTHEQVAAWAARHPGPERFIASAAAGDIILVAADTADHPAAYTLLEPDGHIDMLYCHPDYAGGGLAGHLLVEAENCARAAGTTLLFAEASELARLVFSRAGFQVLQRRDFNLPHAGEDVAIHNYAMEKVLD